MSFDYIDFKPISMMELRSSPGEILDRVSDNNEAFIIEKSGRQKACLVPISFFFPDIPKGRLSDELQSLQQEGKEHSGISFSKLNEIELKFKEPVEDTVFEVRIVLPHGYPSSAPRVYASPIEEKSPHRWAADGSLCIFGVDAVWNPGIGNVATVLSLARQWLSHYLTWAKTGNWPAPSSGEKKT